MFSRYNGPVVEMQGGPLGPSHARARENVRATVFCTTILRSLGSNTGLMHKMKAASRLGQRSEPRPVWDNGVIGDRTPQGATARNQWPHAARRNGPFVNTQTAHSKAQRPSPGPTHLAVEKALAQ